MAVKRLQRTWFIRLIRRLRYYYLRLLLIPDTPRRVALGLAAGVFAGLMPIIPFQSITAIALAWLLGGSKIAAPIGALITNPLTIPPFYAAFYYLGRWITPFGKKAAPIVWSLKELSHVGMDVILASLVGGLIMAIVIAPITYWFTLRYINRLQAYERRKLRTRFDLTPPHII
jgi:uncharacterized protein (DUF2062 family)